MSDENSAPIPYSGAPYFRAVHGTEHASELGKRRHGWIVEPTSRAGKPHASVGYSDDWHGADVGIGSPALIAIVMYMARSNRTRASWNSWGV